MCIIRPKGVHTRMQSFRSISVPISERTNRLFTRELNDCVPISFVFRREQNLSLDLFSIYLFRWERNDSYRYTFRITFLVVSSCGTERLYLKRSRLDATLHHSTFRNITERSGRFAFLCEGVINYIVKWHFQFL